MVEFDFRPRLRGMAVLALLAVQTLMLIFEFVASVTVGLEFFFV